MKRLFLIVLAFITTYLVWFFLLSPQKGFNAFSDDEVTIHLVKQQLHTGVIFSVNDQLLTYIPELYEFKEKRYVDIGWGDEDFYQTPGFNYYLAVKALFIPTNSVLRIAGYNSDVISYYGKESTVIELKISNSIYKKLCEYISAAFYKVENETVKTSNVGSHIIFYRSNGKYTLFNTCNTWIARGLKKSGLPINTFGIITVEQLFSEVIKYGKIISEPE